MDPASEALPRQRRRPQGGADRRARAAWQWRRSWRSRRRKAFGGHCADRRAESSGSPELERIRCLGSGRSARRGWIDQLALEFEELAASATEDELAAEQAAAETTTVRPLARPAPSATRSPTTCRRERVVIDPANGLRVLRRQSPAQARRGRDADAGDDAAAVESDRDGAGEVLVSRLRKDGQAPLPWSRGDGRARACWQFIDLGDKDLKNIARPVRVYQLEHRRWHDRAQAFQRAKRLRPAWPCLTKPSVAVLPFQNMSGDPRAGLLSPTGWSRTSSTGLSRVKWLLVIARNSSFVYKGRAVEHFRQVGRELGVRYVLEGGVRKAGARVRITAQLVDSRNRGAPMGREVRWRPAGRVRPARSDH